MEKCNSCGSSSLKVRSRKSRERHTCVAMAQVMAAKKRLESKYSQAQESSNEWYRRAQLALQKGDEELAKEALVRKKSFDDTVASLESQLKSQSDAVEKLIANTKLLESKVSEAKNKKETLKARAASAKTQQKVYFSTKALGW